MEDSRESGFINSQPCIAEFMTDLGAINERYSMSSITELSRMPSFCQVLNGSDRLPTDITPVNGDSPGKNQAGAGLSSLKVPEYPWMKEKKPSRRHSAQTQ